MGVELERRHGCGGVVKEKRMVNFAVYGYD